MEEKTKEVIQEKEKEVEEEQEEDLLGTGHTDFGSNL